MPRCINKYVTPVEDHVQCVDLFPTPPLPLDKMITAHMQTATYLDTALLGAILHARTAVDLLQTLSVYMRENFIYRVYVNTQFV